MFKMFQVRVFLIALCILSFVSVSDAQGWVMSDDNYEINEDYSDAVFDVLANDVNDTGVSDVFLQILTLPANGTVEIDDASDLLIYTPDENYYGTDAIVYNACANTEPFATCASATANIIINAIDESPDAKNDTVTFYAGTLVFNIELLLNDIDIDMEGVEFEIISESIHGEPTPLPVGDAEYIQYEPFDINFVGQDSLKYSLCKIGSDVYCDTATVYINIISLNFNPPFALNDTATVNIATSVEIDVLANDFDGDADDLIISEVLPGASIGTFFITGANTISYTPTDIGTDDFLYVVCDNGIPSFCDTAAVHINITNTPVAGGPSLNVPNSFSPNGDGINDVLQISGLEDYTGFNLKIFNRWSSLIFETTNMDQSWNGRSNVEFLSTSGDVPEGTYYYILYLDGVADPLTGFIVVKR